MHITAVLICLLLCSASAACHIDNPLFQLAGDSSSDPSAGTGLNPTTGTAAETGSTAPVTGEPPTSTAASTDALTGGPTTVAETTSTTSTATTDPAETTTGGMGTTDTGEGMVVIPACDPGNAALVACFEFNFVEDDPSTFLDGSMYGNHGQLGGPHVITGVNGKALAIGSDTNLLVQAKDNSLSPTSSLTMTAWVRLGDSPNKSRFVINKQDQYDMIVTPSGFLCHAGPYQLGLQIDAPLPLNEWVHLACVYDKGFYSMFVNGGLVASGNNADVALNVTTNSLNLGCGTNCTADTHLDGDLDAVRIWSVALSIPEIGAHAGN